jgi:hypothetical protein
MNGRKVLVLGTASAALIAAIYFVIKDPPDPASPSPAQSEKSATAVAPATTTSGSGTDASPPGASSSVAAIEENSTDGQLFRVDAAGNLVSDEQTRLNIEALIAQIESRELDAAIHELTESLPPAAARLAEEWVYKFVSYQQAQRQAYPPGEAPPTPEDAMRELEGLHALREAHFGPQVAQGFYGREEIIAREMIEVMRVESDQSLTAAEKAEHAKAIRERLPGVSAIEKSNRDRTPLTKNSNENGLP